MNHQATQRVLDIEGVLNFRDLGGYTNQQGQVVRWGKCYRSAQLDRLTEQGVADMSALNIKTVIDLRFSTETQTFPTNLSAFKNAEIIAWEDHNQDSKVAQRSSEMQLSWRDGLASNDPDKVREVMRVNYPKKLYSHQVIYRVMLLKLIEGQTPLVFHCAAGKDRTGVAAALILSLLGVSDEVIVEDYLITEREIAAMAEYWMTGGATDSDHISDFQSRLLSLPSEVIKPIFDADQSYIETLLEYVHTTYGGFEAYALQILGLSGQQLEALRAQLLN